LPRRVASEINYECRRCGERDHGLPMSYGADAPAYWDPSLAGNESSTLEQEQCIIKAEHFFVRGRLVIPVTDAAPGIEFDWGVWVSLSRDNLTPLSQMGSSRRASSAPDSRPCTRIAIRMQTVSTSNPGQVGCGVVRLGHQ
jgi:Uncharacterized protein conserved in bacteria (DUF2199)